MAQKEHNRTTYAPSLADVREIGLEMSPCSKSDFREHRNYPDTEVCDVNLRNVGNFSKISDNAKSAYFPMADYMGFF